MDKVRGRHVSIQTMQTEAGGGHRNCEFPVIDPKLTGQRHDEVVCACDTRQGVQGTTQGLIKLAFPREGEKEGRGGLRTIGYYDPGPRRFCGEPCLIPKSRSRSGSGSEEGTSSFWVIASVHDAATLKADVVILDGDDLSSGPVATLHLPHALPMSLHGAWSEQFLGPEDEDAAAANDFFRSTRVLAVI